MSTKNLTNLLLVGFLPSRILRKRIFSMRSPQTKRYFFLKWVDPHERDRLVGLLSDDQKRSLSSFLGDDDQVALSA